VYVGVPTVVYVVGVVSHTASARFTGTKRPMEIMVVQTRRRRRNFLFSAFFLMVGVAGATATFSLLAAVGGSLTVPKG
jgi:hypothetical protein